MSDPRLCIIGAGGHASGSIYPFIGKAEAQLVGVCDLRADAAERNARRFGGTPYTDFDEMLDREQPDGVIICIGPEQHAELALRMIERGLPVYTEKPPAPSAAKALEVARAAKAKDVLCVTAFKKRYAKVYLRAKEWLAGFPPAKRLALAMIRASGYYDPANPHKDLLLDFEIHTIDLIQYLFGDATRVFAFAKDKHAYAISIEFACGAVGTLSTCDGRAFHLPTEKVELTVAGGNSMSIDNSCRYRIATENQPSEWYEPAVFTANGDAGKDSGHLTELKEFVAAVREGCKDSRSVIAKSYRSLVLYEAMAASARSGQAENVRYEEI